MELAALALFSAGLVLCVAAGASVLYALVFGYLLFAAYALLKKYTLGQVLRMSAEGVLTVKNVLLTLLLIGMLTALWRRAGTIPAIVYYAAGAIRPAVFLPMVFLLNCLVSFLTGTSFGTAATMGVVCMTLARAMGCGPVLAGGAILAGAFFGDRCSPVSTSALLVAELTRTDIFSNIRGMARTAAVPFALSCLIYAGLGLFIVHGSGSAGPVRQLFAQNFSLGLPALLPAAAILLLSALQVKVKRAMLASIAAAIAVSLACQGADAAELLRIAVLGYAAGEPRLAAMLDGGGIVSMLRVEAIVCLSSCYAGIFKTTGLLDALKSGLQALGRRASPRTALCLTSIVTSMIACNQTLAIMLTHQLCAPLEEDRQRLALDLEDLVVVIAPLVPWSIAAAVPLATVSAPNASISCAFYLYLLPLWSLVSERLELRRAERAQVAGQNGTNGSGIKK